MDALPLSKTALQYDTEVTKEGRVELKVPFQPGARVKIFVIEQGIDSAADSFEDLALAAQSSLDFWDNSYDDEDWNHA
jgi:hypothetical protein